MVEKKQLKDTEKSEARKTAELEGAKKPKPLKEKKMKAPKVVKEPRQYAKIGETKHGAVIVINYENCLKLGFNKDTTTKEVIDLVYTKLGLKQ